MPDDKIATLYHEHVVSVFEKQKHLASIVGDASWQFDMGTGVLAFGDRVAWKVQLLGSEAETDETWLWAWANEASRIPPSLLEAARALQRIGREEGMSELTNPQLPLAVLDGDIACVLATGMLGTAGYYRGPYNGGAAFFLIDDPTYPPAPDLDPVFRLLTVFPESLGAYPMESHRAALRGYVRSLGLSARDEDAAVVVEDGGADVITASFDNLERLCELRGSIKPP